MFQMMNEARLMVGANGVATASVDYHASLDYALTRRQGRRLDGEGSANSRENKGRAAGGASGRSPHAPAPEIIMEGGLALDLTGATPISPRPETRPRAPAPPAFSIS